MKRYIGNKEKIVEKIENIIKANIRIKSFFDIFSGTGSVAEIFKKKCLVEANDILFFSKIILISKLLLNKEPNFKKFNKTFDCDVFFYLNNINASTLKNGVFYENFSPKGGRMYFTEKNAMKIDLARQEIDNLKKSKIISEVEWAYLLSSIITAANSMANTTGTFGAFLKKFNSSSNKDIVFKKFNVKPGKAKKVHNIDGHKIIGKIKTDLLYMDPPYTAIDYYQAYHVLETLALYDSQIFRGVTGRRVPFPSSPFTKTSTAKKEFEFYINNAKLCKNILISYSTHGIVDYLDIVEMLKKKYTKVVVEKFEYRKYRNVFSNEKGSLNELLLLGIKRKNETNS